MEIDGSILEGGGQILRVALALSCLTRTPIKIINIRKGRSKPGLAAQHLKGVELLRDMSSARVKGATVGSTELEFAPSYIKGGQYVAHIQTAGSVPLLIQAALPVAYFCNSEVVLDLKGGTNAAMAPQIDFITEILRPNLEQFGVSFDFDLFKRGYFPKGGGHCKIIVKPVKQLRPCSIENFGQISRFFGWSFVAGVLPVNVANDMAEGAKSVFNKYRQTPIEIEAYKESPEVAVGNCSGIILGCETTMGCILGSSALGNREEKSYNTGRKAAFELELCICKKVCVDSYVQDQLIIYMALASGVSRVRTSELTLHTKTAIHVAELMTKAKFRTIEQSADGSCILECNGIGLSQ